MNYYSSDESYDSDYGPAMSSDSQPNETRKFNKFGPGQHNKPNYNRGTHDINLFRTSICRHVRTQEGCTKPDTCFFAHNKKELRKIDDPLPYYAVEIYNKIQKSKKKKEALRANPRNPLNQFNMGTKTRSRRGDSKPKQHNFIFDDQDYEEHVQTPKEETRDGYKHYSGPKTHQQQYHIDTQSQGQPDGFNNPLQKNNVLETAYCNLQVEKLNLEAKYKILENQNSELKDKYDESSLKLHKVETENNSLREMVNKLDAKILELKDKPIPVPKGNSDKYKEIAVHAIEALENITRSPITKNLMSNPVLTPSLTLVDRDDIYQFLDKNPGHNFLKKGKPVKGKLFMPFKGVINLRGHLKGMFEKVADRPEKKSSSSNTQGSKQQAQEIKALNKNLVDRQAQIKHLEAKVKKLENESKSDSNSETKGGPKSGCSNQEKTEFNNKIKQLQNEVNLLKLSSENLRKVKDDFKLEILRLEQVVIKKNAVETELKEEIIVMKHKQKLSDERNSKLQSEKDKLKNTLAKDEQVREACKNLEAKTETQKEEIKNLKEQCKKLEKKLKKKDKKMQEKVVEIQKLKNGCKIEDVKNNESSGNEEAKHSKTEVVTQYTELIDSLKELLECPILYVTMRDPCITYSGVTIDGGVMKEYINSKSRDPWDENQICDKSIRNLLAVKLQHIISKYETLNEELDDSEDEQEFGFLEN